jgi:hypothetical protein
LGPDSSREGCREEAGGLELNRKVCKGSGGGRADAGAVCGSGKEARCGGSRGKDVGAFEWVVRGERSRLVSSRAAAEVGRAEKSRMGLEFDKKELIIKTGESVDIAHHASWPMDNGKVVAEEFLGPAANLMDVAFVIEDFFHGAAVTEPVKVGAPEVFAKLADSPAAASGFPDERVKVAFAFGAATGAEPDRAEAGSFHKFVKGVGAAGFQDSKGFGTCIGVGGLHEDETHAVSGPIGFEEAGFGVVVTREARVAGDGSLEIEEECGEIRGPSGIREG